MKFLQKNILSYLYTRLQLLRVKQASQKYIRLVVKGKWSNQILRGIL